MKRAVYLFVSLLALLWAVPTHAGHIFGTPQGLTVSKDVVKVGENVKVTLKGYVNWRTYKCPLKVSTTEGPIAVLPGEIAYPPAASPPDADPTENTPPYNFEVSFDVSFKQAHSPASINVTLGPDSYTKGGQPGGSGKCDGVGDLSVPVYVMAAEGPGKITGLNASASKVKVGEQVNFTVAGTGGPCKLNFTFPGDSPAPMETSLPSKPVQWAFGGKGTFTVGVTGQQSPTCDGGTVETKVTVEAVEAPQAKKPDLVCWVAAYKDAALKQAIAGADPVTFSDPSPKVYFVVTLQNVGDADIQKPFEPRVQFKFNDKVVANPGFAITPPVSVGQTPRTVTVWKEAVPKETTTMEVTGTVDPKNQIDEKDKANNQCKLTITTKHVVQRQQPASPAQIKEIQQLPPGVRVGPGRVTPAGCTAGIIAVAVHTTIPNPKWHEKSFASPQKDVMVEWGYATINGPDQVRVTFKNTGKVKCPATNASGWAALSPSRMTLDPKQVPSLEPNKPQNLYWDLPKGLQQGALTVVVNLK